MKFIPDNSAVRASAECQLCGSAKDKGLIACWPCYNRHGLRYGNADAEERIAAANLALRNDQGAAP